MKSCYNKYCFYHQAAMFPAVNKLMTFGAVRFNAADKLRFFIVQSLEILEMFEVRFWRLKMFRKHLAIIFLPITPTSHYITQTKDQRLQKR